jgi:hypothetical protein
MIQVMAMYDISLTRCWGIAGRVKWFPLRDIGALTTGGNLGDNSRRLDCDAQRTFWIHLTLKI